MSAVADPRLDLVGEVMRVDGNAAGERRPDEALHLGKRELDQRHVVHRAQGLGTQVGQRLQSPSRSGCEDDGGELSRPHRSRRRWRLAAPPKWARTVRATTPARTTEPRAPPAGT